MCYAQLAEPVLFPYPFPPWSTTGWERWPESRRMAVSAGQVKVNTVHFPVCSAHVSYITRRWAGAGKHSRSPGYGDSVVVHWNSSKTEKTNIYSLRGAKDVLKLKKLQFSAPGFSFCYKNHIKGLRLDSECALTVNWTDLTCNVFEMLSSDNPLFVTAIWNFVLRGLFSSLLCLLH